MWQSKHSSESSWILQTDLPVRVGISGKSRIRVKESIVLEITCLFYPFFLALSDNRGQTSLLELLFKVLFINIFFFVKCDVIMWSFLLVCSQCSKGVPGQALKHSTKNAQPKALKVVLIQLSVGKGKQIFFRTELTDVGSIYSFLKRRFMWRCFQASLFSTGPCSSSCRVLEAKNFTSMFLTHGR